MHKKTLLSNIVSLIEEIAPKSLAYNWDNVGLQIGDSNKNISKVLISLDVTNDVIKAAQLQQIDLIITHHPLFFNPIKRIIKSDVIGGLAAKLIQSDIALYTAHTNLDKSPYGTNKALAEKLCLKNLSLLKPEDSKQLYKFVVFVPEGYEQQIITAIHGGGGGTIGEYTHCTFRAEGVGTFLPSTSSKPFIGEAGKLEQVREYRLETIVPEEHLYLLIRAVLVAHPYEEPAYEVYALKEPKLEYGLGYIGEIEKEVTVDMFIKKVKKALEVKSIRYIGGKNKKVKKAAVCSGAGDDIIRNLKPYTADIIVTGDIKYHTALDARARGLNVIDAGHYATELPVVEHLAHYLREKCTQHKYDVSIHTYTENYDPFNIL